MFSISTGWPDEDFWIINSMDPFTVTELNFRSFATKKHQGKIVLASHHHMQCRLGLVMMLSFTPGSPGSVAKTRPFTFSYLWVVSVPSFLTKKSKHHKGILHVERLFLSSSQGQDWYRKTTLRLENWQTTKATYGVKPWNRMDQIQIILRLGFLKSTSMAYIHDFIIFHP